MCATSGLGTTYPSGALEFTRFLVLLIYAYSVLSTIVCIFFFLCHCNNCPSSNYVKGLILSVISFGDMGQYMISVSISLLYINMSPLYILSYINFMMSLTYTCFNFKIFLSTKHICPNTTTKSPTKC